MTQLNSIANKWINAWSNGKTPAVGEGVSECDLDWGIPREKPEDCLDIILIILGKIQNEGNDKLLSVLAAGPLVDLLTENGKQVVERVEECARKDPLFRKLLNGVWDNDINEDVKSQLSKYMGEKW